MPKADRTSGSRQRPVSCKLCRTRKLRCDREAPCSNCVSRGVSCELLECIPRAAAAGPPSTRSPGPSGAELLERIHRLEELLASHQKPRPKEGERRHSDSTDVHGQSLDKPHRSTFRPIPETEQLDNAVAWLESIYGGHNVSDKIPSSRVAFRICPIRHILEAQPYDKQSACLSSTNLEPIRCVWLPKYAEARVLLEKFIQNLDRVQYVVYTPSLPSILDEVYTCLHQQGQVKPGYAILLLSIFASCTYSWTREDGDCGLFSTPAEAHGQWPLWINAVEDVLDVAHRTTSVSVEGIQGIIITTFVVLNVSGFSRRCRSMFNVALLLAQELGLHRVDHPSNAESANTIQAEVMRRVWWYLVATDWAVSTMFSGVSRAAYLCHPRQMIVKKPLNLNDEDLKDGMNRTERPLSEPTAVAYLLQRIRLGEVLRSFADRTPLITAISNEPSHDIIMDIDTEIQQVISEIPPFFSMSVAELTREYRLDPSRASSIAHQGYIFRSLCHTQRCSLHFPYFSRGYVDSAYAPSRDICLQSARLIIQAELGLEGLGLRAMARCKSLGLLVAVFTASILLLMDLCHSSSDSNNKSPSPEQERRRGEIADAVRILEEERRQSETAAKFLDSLVQALRRHKISPSSKGPDGQGLLPRPGAIAFTAPDDGGPCYNIRDDPVVAAATTTNIQSYGGLTAAAPLPPPMALSAAPGNHESDIPDTAGAFANGGYHLSSYFNDLAQSFEQGMDAGDFRWNHIFSELDSSFI